VCQLLQQHDDTLVRLRVLTLKACALGDVFDRYGGICAGESQQWLRSVADLRELVKTGAGVDPLKDFSEAAREELRAFALV
jgi:hypothetical protein